MSTLLLYAIPCWVINLLYTFIRPLKDKFPVLEKWDLPVNKKLWGDRGIMTIPLLFLLPLLLAPFFAEPYAVLFLKSVCVTAGDFAGSYVKRYLHIPKGTFVPGIDHGDYMIMAGIVFVALGLIPFSTALQALIITYFAHPIFCYVGWRLGIKREPL